MRSNKSLEEESESFEVMATEETSPENDGTEISGYSHEGAIEFWTEAILQQGLPLDYAGTSTFVKFIRAEFQCPAARAITEISVRKQARYRYWMLKTELISNFLSLRHRVALACDVWRNVDCNEYIRVTAHWIDSDWCMHRRIINFEEMLDFSVSYYVYKSIEKRGICDEAFFVTVDEVCDDIDDDDAMEDLKNFLHPISEGKLFRVRCVCRALSSCIQEGLGHVTVELQKIGEGNDLPFRYRERYVDLCRKYGLEPKFDFPRGDFFRWDATRDILKQWMIYKDVIGEYMRTGSPDSGFSEITEQDWEVISVYIRFLDVFYEAVDALSRVYRPSSCVVLIHLVNIANVFSEYRGSPLFEKKISCMEELFLIYFHRIPELFCLAAVMDPRIKLSGCHCLLESYYQCTNNTRVNVEKEKIAISNLLYEMFSQYAAKFSRPEPSSSFSTTSGFAWSVIRKRRQETADSGFNELTLYLQTPHVFNEKTEDNLDILRWWKMNEVTYPALSTMARDLLTTPASTLAPDYAFLRNEERWIRDASRHLRGRMLKIYTCLRDWLLAKDRLQGMKAASMRYEEDYVYGGDVDEDGDNDEDYDNDGEENLCDSSSY